MAVRIFAEQLLERRETLEILIEVWHLVACFAQEDFLGNQLPDGLGFGWQLRLLLQECLDRGVAVVAAAPFNSGILARPWPTDSSHYNYGPPPDEVVQQARDLARACWAAGTELPVAAVQFPLRHRAVASVVVGMRSPRHVASAVAGVQTVLSDQVWASLG